MYYELTNIVRYKLQNEIIKKIQSKKSQCASNSNMKGRNFSIRNTLGIREKSPKFRRTNASKSKIMLPFSTKRDVVYGILTQVYVSKRIIQTYVTKNQRKLTNCAAANY